LKILFLSSNDVSGGAAKAAYRLFNGLREQGISVKMLVSVKGSCDPDVVSYVDFKRNGLAGLAEKYIWKVKNRLRKGKWKKYPERDQVFLNDLSSVSLLKAIRSFEFDVLHLHFVANQFLDLRELTKINKPIIWTLHDCWPFTGICHYFYDCKRYMESCGNCPMLHSDNPNDFTHKIWKVKQTIYDRCRIQLVGPSKWMQRCAQESSLFSKFSVANIPYIIDTEKFRPATKQEARQKLGLNESVSYVLFGAMNALNDSRKGFHLLVEALKELKQRKIRDIELLIFGAEKNGNLADIEYPVHFMGMINNEETLVHLYNASDVLVVPSIAENLANAIIESLACGTPVVGFNIGGNSDMIDHKSNGYLAKPYDSTDLAEGIFWCIDNNKNTTLAISARNKVLNNFTDNEVITKYLDLYSNIV
jgi:glycosyltransferase involved in cell wall biosynthesis